MQLEQAHLYRKSSGFRFSSFWRWGSLKMLQMQDTSQYQSYKLLPLFVSSLIQEIIHVLFYEYGFQDQWSECVVYLCVWDCQSTPNAELTNKLIQAPVKENYWRRQKNSEKAYTPEFIFHNMVTTLFQQMAKEQMNIHSCIISGWKQSFFI